MGRGDANRPQKQNLDYHHPLQKDVSICSFEQILSKNSLLNTVEMAEWPLYRSMYTRILLFSLFQYGISLGQNRKKITKSCYTIFC